MGYYTDYTVSLFAVKKDGEFLFDEETKRKKAIDLFRWINKVRKEDNAKFYPFEKDIDDAIQEFFEDPSGFSKEFCLDSYDVKWYDWKQEMAELSRAFPDLVFKVHGWGEESDDLWDAYFCAGKRQDCTATLEPFDPTKFGGKSPVAVSENSLYLKDFLKTFSYNGEFVPIVLEKKNNIFDYEVFGYHNTETAIEEFGDLIVETWKISHNEAGMALRVRVKKGEI